MRPDLTQYPMWHARVARAEDWPAIYDFHNNWLEGTVWGDRLDCDMETLQGFFSYSMQAPLLFGVVIVEPVGHPHPPIGGAALLMAVGSPYKLVMLQRTFIHGIMLDPTGSRKMGDAMLEGMVEWGRARGHDMLWGNIRMPHGEHQKNGFKIRAVAERYGFEAAHVVLIKRLEGNNGQG